MKIKLLFPVESISGKVNKKDNLVFSKRYNKTYAWMMRPPSGEPTENQLAIQEKFTATTALVLKDMKDPVKWADWEKKAAESNGKYVTARGAAFAYYWEHGAEGGEDLP